MLKSLPKKIRIIEVGPRDGLQNESKIISLQDKLDFIKNLSEAGLKEIEATSFVRAEKISQMKDGTDLYDHLKKEPSLSKTRLIALVPNLKGLESAIDLGAKDIAVFTSTSNSFNLKNINANIDDSLIRIEEVMKIANKSNIKTRGYISTVFGCPYEGKTNFSELKRIATRLRDLGVYEISLGDTIGVANPLQVCEIIDQLSNDFPLSFLAMHFHDTRGLALANTLASLEMGITSFDSSAGGLGGCPYAVGAAGNVATEDLIYFFESMGIQTGVDLDKLVLATSKILSLIGKESPSKFYNVYKNSLK